MAVASAVAAELDMRAAQRGGGNVYQPVSYAIGACRQLLDALGRPTPIDVPERELERLAAALRPFDDAAFFARPAPALRAVE